MSSENLKDGDIADMFAATPAFSDAEAFESRVRRGLSVRLWLRQWLVVLAGFVGGLYALAQFVRMPDGSAAGGKAVYGLTLQKASLVDTGRTLNAGFQFYDSLHQSLVALTQSSAQYLAFMQTPAFFWLSFALCLGLLGLYYAYSQEETL